MADRAFRGEAATFRPAYLRLGLAELRRRADEALEVLRSCEVCPRDCRVDRLADQWSFCRIGRRAVVSSAFPHFGEEDCLRGWNGSGTVFFSMCNLRCAFCVPGDTYVPTNAGMQRIEKVFAEGSHEVTLDGGRIRFIDGLRVCTHEGKMASVAKAFCHQYDGELVIVKPYGLPPLALTPNHAVLAASRPGGDVWKVPAGELRRGDYLLAPKPRPAAPDIRLSSRAILEPHIGTFRRSARRKIALDRLQELATIGAYRKPTSKKIAQQLGYHPAYMRKLLSLARRGRLEAANGDFISNDLIEKDKRVRFKTEKGPGIPSRLRLGRDFATLLGYFCAEGHISTLGNRPNSHRLVFSFGRHEKHLVKRTRHLVRRVFQIQPTVRERHTTITVEVSSASLALLFKSLCGTKARNKRVPYALSEAPSDVIRAFLRAYFQGDGSQSGVYLTAGTVSRDLAFGIVALLLRLGIFPYFYAVAQKERAVIEGRLVNQSATVYHVKCRLEAWKGRPFASKTHYRESEEAFFVPIHRISRVTYKGPVYNLEVDDDHSYIANGIAVANCQNYDISQQKVGREVSAEDLTHLMIALQDQGCHNINLVTPEHVVPQILEALPPAVERGLHLPIVYNTSAYDSMHSLELLDGIVDIYMPDFKFWDRERSRLYLKAPNYPEVARRTIKEMHRQVGPLQFDASGLARRGLLIRHLVMPGALADTQEIMRWIAAELGPESYVNVMAQYRPAGQVGRNPRYEAINRLIHPEEYAGAVRAAMAAGLSRLDQRAPRRTGAPDRRPF